MVSEYMPRACSVLLYKHWLIPAILPLSDEDAGKLIKAICGYWTGADVRLENPQLMEIFTAVAETMERSTKKYLEKIESRST